MPYVQFGSVSDFIPEPRCLKFAVGTTRNPFIYDVLGMTIANLVTEQGSSMTKFRYLSWMTGLGVNPFVQL